MPTFNGGGRGPGGPASASGANGAPMKPRPWGPASAALGGSRTGDEYGRHGGPVKHSSSSGSAANGRKRLVGIDDEEDEEEEVTSYSRSSHKHRTGNSSSSSSSKHHQPPQRHYEGNAYEYDRDDDEEPHDDEDNSRRRSSKKQKTSSSSSRKEHLNFSDDDVAETGDDDRHRRKAKSSSSSTASRPRKSVIDFDDDEDEEEDIAEVGGKQNSTSSAQPPTTSRSKSTLPQVDKSALEPFNLQRKEKPVSKGLAELRARNKAKAAAVGGPASPAGSATSSNGARSAAGIVIPGRTSSAGQGRTIGAGSGIGRAASGAAPSKSLAKALPSEVGKLYDPSDIRHRAKASTGGEDNSIVISDSDENDTRSASAAPRDAARRPGPASKTNGSKNGAARKDAIPIDDDDDDDDAGGDRPRASSSKSRSKPPPSELSGGDAAFNAAFNEKRKAERLAAANAATAAAAAQNRNQAREPAATASAPAPAPASTPAVDLNSAAAADAPALDPAIAAFFGVAPAGEETFNIEGSAPAPSKSFTFSDFFAGPTPGPSFTTSAAAASTSAPGPAPAPAPAAAELPPTSAAGEDSLESFFAMWNSSTGTTAPGGNALDTLAQVSADMPVAGENASGSAAMQSTTITTTVAANTGGSPAAGAAGAVETHAFGDAIDAIFQPGTGGFDFGADDGDDPLRNGSFNMPGNSAGNGYAGTTPVSGPSGVARDNGPSGPATGGSVDQAGPSSMQASAGTSVSVSNGGPSTDGSQLSAAGHAQNPNETVPETLQAPFSMDEDEDDEEAQASQVTAHGQAQGQRKHAGAQSVQAIPGYGLGSSNETVDQHGADDTHMSDAEPGGSDDEEDIHEEAPQAAVSHQERKASDRPAANREEVHTQAEPTAKLKRANGNAVDPVSGSNGKGMQTEGDDAEARDGYDEGEEGYDEEYDEEGDGEEEDWEGEEDEDMAEPEFTFGYDPTAEGRVLNMEEVWDDTALTEAWDMCEEEYEIFHIQRNAALAAAAEGKGREEQERAAAEVAEAMQRRYEEEAAQARKSNGKRKSGAGAGSSRSSLWKHAPQPGSKVDALQREQQADRKAKAAQQAAQMARARADAEAQATAEREAKKAALRAQIEEQERERLQAEADEARRRVQASRKKAAEERSAGARDQGAAAQEASASPARGGSMEREQTPEIVVVKKRVETTVTTTTLASSSASNSGTAAPAAAPAPAPAATAISPSKGSRMPIKPAPQVFAVAAPKVRPAVPANAEEEKRMAKEAELMQLAGPAAAAAAGGGLIGSVQRLTGFGGPRAVNSAWALASRTVAKTANQVGGEKSNGKSKAADDDSGEDAEGAAYRLREDETSLAKTLETFLRSGSAAATKIFKLDGALPLVPEGGAATRPSWPQDELAQAQSDMLNKLLMSYYWVGHYTTALETLNQYRIAGAQPGQPPQQQQAAGSSAQALVQQQQYPSGPSGSGAGASGSTGYR
ncbi:hypothetical protein OC844_002023 [Tilletia horrida]|nr:hypothetical protein OC844_002023 [Tilletia horrida]